MTTNPENQLQQGDLRHVTVAVLTYRRTDELRRAVDSVVAAAVPRPSSGWRLEEILVVDNNQDGAAEPVVAELRSSHGANIRYVNETTPGIVAGRNRALTEAAGDVMVFIDDDEIALDGWPDGLLRVMEETGAAMVGGPVNFEFVEPPTQWVVDSGLFDRPSHADGSAQTWLRSGNIAIDLPTVRAEGLRFDPRYPHGEDATFSRLARSKGLDLRWSSTAAVMEYVEPERTTLQWRRHRDRISTDAWVRAGLDLDSSLRSQSAVATKAAARFAQGVVAVGVGMARRSEATKNSGLALISQARGGIDGLMTHRRGAGPTTER
ncbi:MAG: glycosyltransferase family 2 protein [Acidimicrobiales bacterium]